MNFRKNITGLIIKLNKFMQGRYGTDEISYILLGVSLVFMMISNFEKLWFFNIIGIIPLALSFARMMSKNITARISERERFLNLVEPIKAFGKLQKNKKRDRKTHRYFKCKKCKAVLRVPKGKGKISITCPKCSTKLIKKT